MTDLTQTTRVDGARAFLLAMVLMVLGTIAAASDTTAQTASSVRYELHITCPELAALGAIDPNTLSCPIKAIDEADIMGSPSIAVDPSDPQNIVLASLHGSDASGPTDRSRGGQPFTTFVSSDAGARWTDNPFNAPRSLSNSYGEHPQAVVDSLNRVYVGSLYSTPDSGAPSGFTYTIVAQKFKDLFEVNARQSGEYNAQYLEAFYPDNIIPQYWFIWDNATGTMNLIWYETVPKIPEVASLGDDVTQALADDDQGFAGARSVIGVAWTTPRKSDPYHYIADEYLLGPCKETSNPVIAHGMIYIACLVDHEEGGYAYDDNVTEGQIDIFRMEVRTGVPTYLGTAPINGGHPALGVRNDGRIVLLSAGSGADMNTRVFAAYGQADPNATFMSWTESQELGKDITKARKGIAVTEARIQDITYREDSGVLQFILKEQFQAMGVQADDPGALAESRYHKKLVAIHEDYRLLKQIDLDVGSPRNRTVLSTNPTDEIDSVFNDLTDDIVLFPPGTSLPPGQYWDDKIDDSLNDTYQREFIAIGDYGIVQYAEVVEITDLRAPGIPAAPAAAPALLSAALNPATIGMTVLGTALTGLFALKLALNRSTTASASVSRGE